MILSDAGRKEKLRTIGEASFRRADPYNWPAIRLGQMRRGHVGVRIRRVLRLNRGACGKPSGRNGLGLGTYGFVMVSLLI